MTAIKHFEINHRQVAEAEFLAFKKQLKIESQPRMTAQEAPPPDETPGNYSGNEAEYRAEDPQGKKYTYLELTQRRGVVFTNTYQLTAEE